MAKSPCIGCEFELADKNNPTCRECDRRVEYVALIEEEINGQRSEVGGRKSDAKRIKKIEIEETAGVRIDAPSPIIPVKIPVKQKRKYHKSTINNQQSKECLIKGCDEEVYCRGLCRNHYQQWYKGYIDHPVLGKYKVAQPKKNSMTPSIPPLRGDKGGCHAQEGIQGGEQEMNKDKIGSQPSTQSFTEPGRAEGTKDGRIAHLKVDLDNYPKIKHQIDFLADKYLVNSEHVIIGLIGEALAARRERSDHE